MPGRFVIWGVVFSFFELLLFISLVNVNIIPGVKVSAVVAMGLVVTVSLGIVLCRLIRRMKVENIDHLVVDFTQKRGVLLLVVMCFVTLFLWLVYFIIVITPASCSESHHVKKYPLHAEDAKLIMFLSK